MTVVARSREPGTSPGAGGCGLLAATREKLDVRVAERVDRLLRVAHREQVAARDRVDQLELDCVGVLKLVHHHPRKTLAIAVAELGVVAQKVA